MFGREEQPAPEVQLTPDEMQQRYDAALARIERIGDEDFLDGYKLPPDNEDLWNPRTLVGVIMGEREVVDETTGKKIYEPDNQVVESESRMTNAYVRHVNISTISAHGRPLFIRWEEVDTSNLLKKPEKDHDGKTGTSTETGLGKAAMNGVSDRPARRVGGMRLDEILGVEEAQRVAEELGGHQGFRTRRRRSRRRMA